MPRERSTAVTPPFGPVILASTAPSAPRLRSTVVVAPLGRVTVLSTTPSAPRERSTVVTPPFGPVILASTAPSAPRLRSTVVLEPLGRVTVLSTTPSVPRERSTVVTPPFGPVIRLSTAPSAPRLRSIVVTLPFFRVIVVSTSPSAPRVRSTLLTGERFANLVLCCASATPLAVTARMSDSAPQTLAAHANTILVPCFIKRLSNVVAMPPVAAAVQRIRARFPPLRGNCHAGPIQMPRSLTVLSSPPDERRCPPFPSRRRNIFLRMAQLCSALSPF